MDGDGWMIIGLSVVRGEKSHGRFGSGDRQPPVIRPLRYSGEAVAAVM